MRDPVTTLPSWSDRSEVTDAVRLHILATGGTGTHSGGQRAKRTHEKPGGTPPHQRRRMR